VAELLEESGMKADWNVLTEKWLDTMATGGQTGICSPLEILSSPSSFRCLTASNPLDLFAAHRFLLTLLYRKSDAGGGARIPPEWKFVNITGVNRSTPGFQDSRR